MAVGVLATGAVHAAQAPNPRGTTTAGVSTSRTVGTRTNATTITSGAGTQSRAATRRTTAPVSNGRAAVNNVVNVQNLSARVAARKNATGATTPVSRTENTARAATSGVARSAVASGARAASNVSGGAGVSRAASSRATAVFNDISKIGGGYSQCREAYSTCMDQFCATANDTYRRCFCSAKYSEFRNTEAALDEAKNLLLKFEDNNLNAVGKTADEVAAMYSATAGEMAIKSDVSGAASMLEEIGDLLSGNKKPSTSTSSQPSGLINVDFTADIDDIWGDTSASSIFASTSSTNDLSALEGVELYNTAHNSCIDLVKESCTNDAVLGMAKSAYGILITQDCNTYEKRINQQRETVMQTVRTAEKYLRDARLEEYQSHNSADVNECVAKVKAAMTTDAACGVNYVRCLDYSGAYISQTTGEPIYSPRLFQLADLITLDGSLDVVAQNPEFESFLDGKRMYASSALDTCRDQAELVWSEFKRAAIIEIAQAQDEKIEEVKMSCVSTMKECYDTQSNALKSFDDTSAQKAGALTAYTSRAMCQDKVIACASLYGDTNGCTFDGNGRLTKGNATSTVDGTSACGLSALLTFVDTVDDTRIAEGCVSAVESYAKDLCTPSAGNQGYPWNCRTKIPGSIDDLPDASRSASLASNIKQFAVTNCSEPGKTAAWANLSVETRRQIENTIEDIQDELAYQLMEACEEIDGYWQSTSEYTSEDTLLTAFYSNVYGGNTDRMELGRCVENSTRVQCLAYNALGDDSEPMATYDRNRDECIFTEAWYQMRCSVMGSGYYENGICYVDKD